MRAEKWMENCGCYVCCGFTVDGVERLSYSTITYIMPCTCIIPNETTLDTLFYTRFPSLTTAFGFPRMDVLRMET